MKRLVLVLLAACSGGTPHHASSSEEAPHTAKITKGEVVDRVLVTGSLEAKSAEEMRVPMTEAWELPIRWMAEDGSAVKKGDRVLEFDNSQFTAQLEQKKLSLLDAAIAFNTFEGVTALDIQAKDFALQTAQIALAKAKVLASVPEDLLPARTFQERQLELKRA
jgi:multidrug efflux pump subunit AcrA (membrane-fusion protein)